MLEIVGELDDVERAVAGFEQMRLRTSWHLTQIPPSSHALGPMLTGQNLTTLVLSAKRRHVLEQSCLRDENRLPSSASVGWVFFRAKTFATAAFAIGQMFSRTAATVVALPAIKFCTIWDQSIRASISSSDWSCCHFAAHTCGNPECPAFLALLP